MEYLTTILFFVAGIIGNLIASEAYDWLQRIAEWLIKRAVARLPVDEQDRYREEWLSHLEEYPGKFSKLLHANGCYIAIGKLNIELRKPRSQRVSSWPSVYFFVTVALVGFYLPSRNGFERLAFDFAPSISFFGDRTKTFYGNSLDLPSGGGVGPSRGDVSTSINISPAEIINHFSEVGRTKIISSTITDYGGAGW